MHVRIDIIDRDPMRSTNMARRALDALRSHAVVMPELSYEIHPFQTYALWQAATDEQPPFLQIGRVLVFVHHLDDSRLVARRLASTPAAMLVVYSGNGISRDTDAALRRLAGKKIGLDVIRESVPGWAELGNSAGTRRPAVESYVQQILGTDPPTTVAVPADDLLEPLLALGVLLDGYLACEGGGSERGAEWFGVAIDAARGAPPPRGHAVGSAAYWEELSRSQAAVDRLGKILETVTPATGGVQQVLESARRRADSEDYHEIYRWACGAVRRAWNCFAAAQNGIGSSEVPRGEELRQLVEEASDGFHVLAAGHL